MTWVVLFGIAFGLHKGLRTSDLLVESFPEISVYSGFLAIILGSVVVILTLKIIAYDFFFFKSMRAGVPLLLFNVFSLVLSLLIFGWILASFFNVQLTSVLITSAVLTIVLGLALQDTLGNLFAAISLQIDKPFELDDWIELKNENEKIAGQVKELSWRSTILLAITEEYITIPNRMLAQWQIVNFSARLRPFYRGYYFRIPFESSIETARAALLKAISTIPEACATPAPLVIVTETTDSWVLLKAIYAITDYGSQYVIADRFYASALDELAKSGIVLAKNRLQLN